MKIGLIGYFGAGAYSDDLIEHVTKQLLLKEKPKANINSSWRQKCIRGTDPKLLNSFDLIIQAGGSLLGKCEHYPITDIHRWHDKIKTPMAIFGTGYRYEPKIEPLNKVRKRRLQLLFKKAQVISVRGHRTMHHLRSNKIDVSRVVSVGDPVMACDIKLKINPKFIMGNVRYSPQHEVKHASNERTQMLMAEIYDWLIDHYDLPLVLISFRNARKDNDTLGAEKVRILMKHADKVKIISPKNFREAVEHMKNAAFWFGQRLHPTVFAGVQGIPFVGVEYQFEKMIDWAGTVGIDNYINTKNATLNTFIKKFHTVPRNMKTLRRNLPLRVKEIKAVAKYIMRLV